MGTFDKRNQHTEKLIESIVFKVLTEANKRHLGSIGLPPFGIGGNKCPVNVCARAMFKGIKKFKTETKSILSLKKIHICIFDLNTYNKFGKEKSKLEAADSDEEDAKVDSDSDNGDRCKLNFNLSFIKV